jgi:uncharacterized NAD(P)/FAD-binding protein YdhS
MQTIAIIGAGFSGTMVAAHLLRLGCPTATTIVLIERTGRFTAGVAYGTSCDSHLLNVPAGRMSAFDNGPDHFLSWARTRNPCITGGTFVQRRLYGDYLAHVLNDAEAHSPSAIRLVRVPGQAISISPFDHEQLTVDLGGGGLLRADAVVLAIGNFPPAHPCGVDTASCSSVRYSRDPWAEGALDVSAHEPVLLIGTGLTMLDIALALRDQGHRGVIHAISRRGLLPQPHRHSATPPPQHDRPGDLDSWPRTARGLLRALRAEVDLGAARGVDWREVVTSLRADTPALWQSLPMHERRRFLQHLRPFWETHRHRAAPLIAQQVQAMIDAGQLQVMAGRVVGLRAGSTDVEVRIRRRGTDGETCVRVARVINCTGPDTDLARVDEPLIADLRKRGVNRPDSLGLGLDTTPDGSIINANGRPCRRLWLVGPLRKGQLWENTAVPELRIEAERLARRLFSRRSVRNVETPRVDQTIDAGYALQC